MSKIKIMDEILANKIAAGEVVERSASVVKELVENSIDAGSTEIKVEVIDAGTKEVKVTDNGVGMEKEDAMLAFSRHATSKLLREEDLYHIATLGFRGEALPSIASVSEITLKTSTGEIGTVVELSGGHVTSVTRGDARKGTILSVRNLFYNTPARLKHIKSLQAELAVMTDYMNKIALSHPKIKFTFSNNGHIILKTDGSGDILKTIHNIYGLEITKKMLFVEGENDDYTVEGYISLPEVHRSTRNHMVTLVNGRVVRNMELNRVINDAYHSYKPDNRYPIVVLNIEVDPSLIDVNIHPTKQDIKFSKLDQLSSLITEMIRTKLSKRTLIPHIKVEEEEKVVKEKPKYETLTLDFDMPVSESETTYQVNDDFISAPKEEEEMEEENDAIFTEDVEEKKERLPMIYPVGVVHGTYVICQNELGMYMMDQHAAKERVNYEKFKREMGEPNQTAIAMLIPLTIELSNQEFMLLKQHMEVLERLKFKIEEFGVNSIIVKEHPTWLPNGYEEQAIRKIIEIVLQIGDKFSIEKFNERVATMMSCKLAIKANDYVSMEELAQLIADLRNCDNPFHCPHGRPTIIFYSNYDLEKLFKRSGFDQLV